MKMKTQELNYPQIWTGTKNKKQKASLQLKDLGRNTKKNKINEGRVTNFLERERGRLQEREIVMGKKTQR